MVDRLVKEMGVEGRKSAYESVLQPGAVKRLSMKNDPVFFLDELTEVFARHPNWTMPKDQLNGTAPASLQRDGLSDMRVAVFMRLPPDSSMVNYFWKVLSETDAMGICRRIVGMVAPHDTDKFEAPLYDVQAQWESLRAFPVNTGQVLDRTMELRGRKACDIFNKFAEKINMRSSDFSDPKVPATTKARGTQASVSAFGGASGGRSSRNESRMRDIFGVGHMRGGHNQNSQGPETRGASWRDKENSRKRDGSLSSY